MKNISILIFAFFGALALGTHTSSAQITITLPKLPKISKPKKEQPKEEPITTTSNNQPKDNQAIESKPAATTDKCSKSLWLERHLEEIAKRQKEVDNFTPERGWFTGNFTYDHLLNAVSPSAREKWLKDSNALEYKDCPNFVAAFDNLAASVAKKLPLYTANPKAYNFRNATEEKMMKETLENVAALKIYKIGLNQANWLISKDDYGLPTSRYKHGMIWLRDAADDHPYCKIYYINVIQDYAGGGTYGTSHTLFTGSDLAGCPVNAK